MLRRGIIAAFMLFATARAGAQAEEAFPLVRFEPERVDVIEGRSREVAKFFYKPNEYWVAGTDVVNEFSIEDAKAFYTRLFTLARTNFIRPIKYNYMVEKVLESLSRFLGKMSVEVTDRRLLLYDGKYRLVGNFALPDEEDAESWANMAVNIILQLRERDPEVRAAHPEQIYYMSAAYFLSLLDESSEYLDPFSARRKKDALYNSTALGFTYRRIEGGVQILDIVRYSPVFYSSIREGDAITHISGRPVAKMTDEELESYFVGSSENIVPLKYVAWDSGKPLETAVRRAKVKAGESVTLAQYGDYPVIVVHDFSKGAAAQMLDVLCRAKGTGLIIDLRAVSGGEVVEAAEAANLFLDGTAFLKVIGAEGRGNAFTAKAGDEWAGRPVVLVMDNTTRGAAEAFALALRGRAASLGSPTFGDGYVRQSFEITRGREARFAVAEVFGADGYKLAPAGVVPAACLASLVGDDDVEAFIKDLGRGAFRDSRALPTEPTKADTLRVRKACPAVIANRAATEAAYRAAEALLDNKDAYDRLSGYDK